MRQTVLGLVMRVTTMVFMTKLYSIFLDFAYRRTHMVGGLIILADLGWSLKKSALVVTDLTHVRLHDICVR